MKTLIVDDDMQALSQLYAACASIGSLELIGVFNKPQDALNYAEKNTIELAFLGMEMKSPGGLNLALRLRSLYPGLIVIFIINSTENIAQALKMDADYFIMKPFTEKDIENAAARASLLATRIKKRIFIKAFGNFDVFVDGVPIKFPSAKAKELLAYLVDRNGNVVFSEEGFSLLWEDRCFDKSSASSYRKVLSRLNNALSQAGALDMLHIMSRGRAINKSAVDCDYFSFLEGSPQVVNNWNGEYMTNYSWGEYTLANLLSLRSIGTRQAEAPPGKR